MDELLQLIEKTYGLAGLLIIAPAVAAVVTYRDKKAAEKMHARELAEANEKIVKVHELRIADATAHNEKLLDLVKESTALTTETNAALEKMSDKLAMLRPGRG